MNILGDVTQVNNSTELVLQIADILRKNSAKIAVAESLTGGALASAFVDVAGVSDVFPGGVISYSNLIKHELLGVDANYLQTFGAVNAQVALAMARGVAKKLHTDYAISTTGVAGPQDTADGKAGTVFVGMYFPDREICREFNFSGNRNTVRELTVKSALSAFLAEFL